MKLCKLYQTLFINILLFSFLCNHKVFAQTVKVACVGNSVTYGYGLENRMVNSYPAQLQKRLGSQFEVQNFGHSGATLLRKGHNPYQNLAEYAAAIAFKPAIVIIHLGLNDTDPRDWPNYQDDFIGDYGKLILAFRKVNPSVKIYICKLTPIFSGHPRFLSGTRDWYGFIQDNIEKIATAYHTELLDFHKALYFHANLFPDQIHPNIEGATILAKTVYEGITGDFGGLKLASVFASHMVLQRNEKIPFYGSANAGSLIKVTFKGQTLDCNAAKDGAWKVEFPAEAAGGPYQVKIEAKNKIIRLDDVLLGDVWLCSGQSNMDFPLQNAFNAKEELAGIQSAPLKNMRLLHFDQIESTNPIAWDTVVLKKTNELQFFHGQWAPITKDNAAQMSAIAYFFGKKLTGALQVPIGIIQASVGGSPIASWIDRNTLEHQDQLLPLLNDWQHTDFLMPWVQERALQNIALSNDKLQRHPYQPTYNYEACIATLLQSPIKGVLWYQGESDVHNVELYAQNLQSLVKSWRDLWHKEFPFYWVQLSSLDRPSWAYFRNMQREMLQKIPNVGMAVSSDLGNVSNVHPTHKQEVGERMAATALLKTYQQGAPHEVSPYEPSVFHVNDHQIEILIDHCTTLKTARQEKPIGIALYTDKGEKIEVNDFKLKNNKIIIPVPNGKKIVNVVYAWNAFTNANLVNELGFPVSTFKLNL